ncbi:glycosyltransferase family A protein [Bradyrhizobium neotropicale]|uniref:glycosyltransferase family 2 protein n=1 Tax=Bradyrhizobium neotropicale TaxID=1497615 RepID=UPI001AD63599|nr:glycosyltransferase family A protein [Bradyrhizobium neotropicale]MBO4223585.1 glycosyltransferase [Bradyrhizobium neotropicale]
MADIEDQAFRTTLDEHWVPAEQALPLLTAVVPNFNHGALIGEAIEALAKQTPCPDEIIVVDDGSTDNSVVLLERLKLAYPMLRVVRFERNRGAIPAMNRGLQEARGRYVYFGAADDVTRPGLFAAMLAELERHPQAAFASCEATVLDQDTGRTAPRPPVRPSYVATFLDSSQVARLLRRIDNWILTGTAVVRRDLIIGAGGFDTMLGPFADSFVFRRLSLEYGCCFVPRDGVVWKTSSVGLSRSSVANPDAAMLTLERALERMRADPVFPRWYPAVFERRWRFAIGRLASEARPMNRAVLMRLGRGAIGRAVLKRALAVDGCLGRLAALIWLTLQERPTSLLGLLRTKLSRSRFFGTDARDQRSNSN